MIPRLNGLSVVPAQAGIQEAEITPVALDPRFRWGDDNLLRLHAIL